MTNQHIQPTNLRALVKFIAHTVRKKPKLADSTDDLMAYLARQIAGFDDDKHCLLCGGSTKAYIHAVTIRDVVLLTAMAATVKRRKRTMSFTEANKVEPAKLNIGLGPWKRLGYARKLGLIAPIQDSGPVKEWAITRRGWAALRGEPVPKAILVFKDRILERDSDKITVPEIISEYRKKKSRLDTFDKTWIELYDPNNYS